MVKPHRRNISIFMTKTSTATSGGEEEEEEKEEQQEAHEVGKGTENPKKYKRVRK
jgi:hypothetical protein